MSLITMPRKRLVRPPGGELRTCPHCGDKSTENGWTSNRCPGCGQPWPSAGTLQPIEVRFGRVIKRMREERNISAVQMAGLLEVTTAHLHSLETGSTTATIRHLERIAAVFNVLMSEITDPIEPY